MTKLFLFNLKVIMLSMLCVLASVPTFVFAQAQNTETPNVPLSISARGITFNNTTRAATFDMLLTNNTDDFVDTINYRIEFYAGDALAKEGLLFSTVDFVYAATGDFGRLSPREQRQQNIELLIPETIPGGNYFFRIFAHTDDDSYYGATFTREPTRLTGLGTFLPNLQAALIHPGTNQPHALMEGPLLDLDSTPFVAIMREINPDAFALFDKRPDEYFISYKITHINEPEKTLTQIDKKPLKDFLGEDNAGNAAIEIPFAPWEAQQPGAHTVEMQITDSRGNPVSNMMRVRLLYKGLLGRIFTAESGINSYRRGEPIDLRVNVIAAGDERAEKVTLVTRLQTVAGETLEYRKDVPLNKSFEGIDTIVDFSDNFAKKPLKIESINLELLDASGVVMDTHQVTMDTSKTFAYPKSFSWPWFVGIVLFLAAFGALVTAYKKKLFKIPSLVVLVMILGIASVFFVPIGDTNVAYAQTCGDNLIDSGEECDTFQLNGAVCSNFGYPGGTLSCDWQCRFDTSSCLSQVCGNGSIEGTETCDGSNLGGYTCQYGGTASCTSTCALDTSSCFGAPVSGCTDPNATNYNAAADTDDGSCTYEIRGCTDGNASNYNPAATIDDGSCIIRGCTDPDAVNYNSAATQDDGSCTNVGCTDPIAPGYNPKATVNDPVLCNYRQLYGDMLKIWQDPVGPSGDLGMCTSECKPMTFWVKLQCKQCGNDVLSITVNHINNVQRRTSPTGFHDRQYVVTTSIEDPSVYSYGTITVQGEQETPVFAQAGSKLNPAPIGELTGTPIQANDLINWWIYGPFQVDVCPEVEPKCESPDVGNDGVYRQSYEISAVTQFGAGYCELDYEGTGQAGQAIAKLRVDTTCTMPGCIEGTFFNDEDKSGSKGLNELFLKSSGAPAGLQGSAVNIKGAVEKFQKGFYARNLPAIWDSAGQPAFRGAEFLPADKYRALLDDSSGGWIQTTAQNWRDVAANRRVKELIGVASGYPVTISCGVYSGGSMCGDGVIGGSEQCDGSNLNEVTCPIRGFEGGTLSCNSDCSFNANACANKAAITTTTPSAVTQTTFTTGGEVTNNGGSSVTARGIVWSTSANPTIALSTKTSDGDGNGTFTSNITSLTCGTTYNVRAYATNVIGTSYGANQIVTTSVCTTATVTSATPVATSYTAITAGGNVTADGGRSVTARGVVWGTGSSDPTIALTTKTSDGSGTGSFTSSITGLTCGNTYKIRAYATNSVGTSYGTTQTLTLSCAVPTVTTGVPTLVPNTVSAYSFTASINNDGGRTVTTSGVVWGTAPNPDATLTTKISPMSSLVGSSANFLCGTTYYVRAYATNVIGTGYGVQQTVNTPTCAVPTVTTSAASIVVTDQITVSTGGNVTSGGDNTAPARGVVWGTSVNPTIALATKTSNGAGTGSFTSSITGLTCATTYYIRAYATNSIGTGYGAQQTVNTPACAVPSVTSSALTVTGQTTASAGGTITNSGGNVITARGVVWGTSANPTIALATKTNNGTGTGSFTSNITGLTCGTTYRVRAYATNATGTGYGMEQVITPMCNALPVVNSPKVGYMRTTSVTFGANRVSVGFANGVLAVPTAQGFCYGTTANPTTANTCTNLTGLSDGAFETYRADTFNPSVLYYYRAYVTTAAGTAYSAQDTFRVSPITYVAGAAAEGSTITIPTHQANDLLIMFAYRDGTTASPAAPTIPTGAGWVSISSGSTNSNSSVVAYRVATAGNLTAGSGTWTNATGLAVHVYRGSRTTSPIGGKQMSGSNTASITYPAITMSQPNGSSLLVFFAGHRNTNTRLDFVPTSNHLVAGFMQNRTNATGSVNEVNGNDSGAGVKSWAAASVNVLGTTGDWRTHAFEILAP